MNYRDMEMILKAIGEETRLKIIHYLLRDTFCVCELVELLEMSQPSVSQHLRRLRQVEVILEESRGKWVFYSLNKSHELYPLFLHLINLLPPVSNKIQWLMEGEKRFLCT